MNWRVKRTSRFLLLAILASVLLLSAATSAGAQTSKTVRFKGYNYEVSGNFLPVGNPADGHFVGLSIRKGLTTFETGEISATSAAEYVDVIKGVGTTAGYVTDTFDDGSSLTARIENHFAVGPNGLFVASIKSEYIKGTGRFEGVKGTATVTAKQVKSTKDFAGFTEIEGTTSYTLPK